MKGLINKRYLLLVLVLLLFHQNIFSREREWVCSLTSFTGTLGREESFLLRHFPLLLYHKISAYETHLLSEEELDYWENEERRGKNVDLVDKWEKLLKERNQLLFEEDSEEYDKLTNELEQVKKSLKYAESDKGEGERESITQRELPFRIITPGEGALLFESPEDALAVGADFVLSGSIGRTGDYFLIELYGRHGMNEEILPLWTGLGKLEDLDRLAQDASDSLKTSLLGRAWSALSVTVNPGEGQIFFNGASLGTGQAARETLEPGKGLLEIRLSGYQLYTEEIELKAFQRLSREITLRPGDSDLIEIISQPAGGEIFLGSSFMGETPLTINRPAFNESLILVLDGYDRIVTSLGPDSPGRIELNFASGGVNWEEQRLVAKDKFYSSLGFFTLSLAAPVVLYGAAENQASLVNGYASAYNLNPSQDLRDRYNQAYDRFNLSYGAFWGTLAVSGVLLGVSINRLVKYIKASEKSMEQKD